MNIVIIGAGEVGTHIASQLIAEQKNVVIVEKDADRARRANDTLDCLVINGEGTNIDTLTQAGIEKADIFIAATSIDEVNMVSCLVAASEFKIPVKIARVRNVEYTKTGIFEKSLIGIDYIVNPEVEAAYEIAQAVELGASSSIFSFHGTDAQLRDFLIEEGSFFENKTLIELRSNIKEDFIIAGVLRDDAITIPSGDFQLKTDDHIYMVSLGGLFNKILGKIGRKPTKLKRIVIVGGGIIGRQVAQLLITKGRDVILIEKDYERCKFVSSHIPEVTVINSDISDKELFVEENLSSADAIVTTTQNEEMNILAGIYAKTQGVKRAIALLDKSNYLTLATTLGIDACVSPKTSSVDAILKFIRKGNIQNVYTIFEGRAEAIEFIVNSHSMIANRSLKDLKLPKGCLIVAIQRKRKTIIPSGLFIIEGGDSVIAFVTNDAIAKLEDILEL